MLRGGGGVTGPRTTGAGGAGARTAGGAAVVGTATALRASVVVVLGRGAVVVGAAAVVVVGMAVVVVVNDVVVDEAPIGSSVAATCIPSGAVRPAGPAPVHVDTPSSAAARSGLAMTGFMAIGPTRIVGQHITEGVGVKGPSGSDDT